MVLEPVNELERSLKEAVYDPARRMQFYNDLLQAEIYAITADEQPYELQDGVWQESAELSIQPWERGGIMWMPIYSSLKRLQKCTSTEVRHLRLKAVDFFEQTRGNYVVLNPFDELVKEFVPEEIERMLDGSIFETGDRYLPG